MRNQVSLCGGTFINTFILPLPVPITVETNSSWYRESDLPY